jgi:signal transduction histidine kinase
LVFACGILLALASLLWWHAVWLAVVFLLLTLCAGFLSVQGQARFVQSDVPSGVQNSSADTAATLESTSPAAVLEAQPSVATPSHGQYWTDWLGGWYWQTDDQFRLILLKPPAGAPVKNWADAHALVAGLPTLWEIPASTAAGSAFVERGTHDPGHALADSARHMLQAQLRSGGQVHVPGLAWPKGLGIEVDAPQGVPTLSRILGQARLDAAGHFVGHHGVWTPDAPSQPALVVLPRAPVLTLVETSPEPRRSEEEINMAAQESLRFALSHDLRAPLRVVDGFARILKEDYGPAMDRIGKDHLERILSATVRMNGMIDAVLDQARLSQAPLQLVRVNLSALVRDIVTELLVGMRPEGGTGASPACPQLLVADGLWHLADEVLLRRVLENLLGNALKYSAKVTQARIEFGAVPATNPTVFFVKDNGAGFDMKHADKLFGLFQRLHSAREFQGTGVGLASVQNIVRRHGGRVWAEGAPGEGACFYFTLASFGTAGAHPSATPGQAAVG